MKDRAEAFILQTKSGQWMVEVWSAGEPVQCVAGLESELDAVEEASSLAEQYGELEFVITQGKERPTP
jgi:hypothetical protein